MADDYSDWGAEDIEDEKETQEGLETLVASNIRQAAKIRQLEVALSAERRRASKGAGDEALGELAIRTFLDDLEDTGVPSTAYQTFSPAYRAHLARGLAYWAETANRMLGAFLTLPPDAIAARDKRYGDKDDSTPPTDIEEFLRSFESDGDDD